MQRAQLPGALCHTEKEGYNVGFAEIAVVGVLAVLQLMHPWYDVDGRIPYIIHNFLCF